jgi:hypothetical protein
MKKTLRDKYGTEKLRKELTAAGLAQWLSFNISIKQSPFPSAFPEFLSSILKIQWEPGCQYP